MGIFILKPEEKEINFFYTYYTKMNFKEIIDLNMNSKTIKSLLDNITEYLLSEGWKRLLKHITLFNIIIVGEVDKSTLKLRTSSHEKTSLREWKSQSRGLQLINDSYPEYIVN